MADSPTANADGPVGLTIKIGGSEIADDVQVLSVSVSAELGRIPQATVVMQSGSVAENDFADADGTDSAIGSEISIAGFYGSGDAQDIFLGVVTGQRMRVTSGDPTLELTCRDKAATLLFVRKSAFYAAKKDSDIMTQIVTDAGLTADITATTDTARDQLRHDCTDWSYLLSIADRSGHVVKVADGKITSAPPDTAASAVLTVGLGVDIFSLDAETDSRSGFAAAKGRSWDDDAQSPVEGASAAATDPAWGTTTAGDLSGVLGDREFALATSGPMAEADLKTVADARVARSVLAGITGTCSFTGSGSITPGDVLEITGVGDRFGGMAYVSGVEQRIDAGDWITRVSLGLPDNWAVDADGPGGPAAAGLTAPVHGLQVGKVLQVHEDPDSKLRIKLSLPMMADPAPELWARFAAPYATASAGIQFLPEVDDEVVVGFFTADPNTPVVIGALHNGVAARGYEATADNYIKAIATNAQLKIEFDDEKKTLTVSTPGGHSVVMDDDATSVTVEDSTGNKLEMTDSGLTLSSPGDVTIKADGKIDIQATGDATLKGQNVTAQGQMGVTAKGGSQAELSSGGQTAVKGSMVMIN